MRLLEAVGYGAFGETGGRLRRIDVEVRCFRRRCSDLSDPALE